MTGIEALREEMMARGCTQQQCKTKAVSVVLDIVSNSGDKYTSAWEDKHELDEQIEKLRRNISRLQGSASIAEERAESARSRMDGFKRKLEEIKAEIIEYREEFDNSLRNMETAESRDILRMAQLFINSTKVETDQNNSMFIQGLANIMAGGKGISMETLRKTNEDLPETDIEPRIRVRY